MIRADYISRTIYLLIAPLLLLQLSFASPKFKIVPELISPPEITIGTTQEFVIKISNDGNEALLIHDAIPDCSCIKISLPEQNISIAPNQSLSLIVVIAPTLGIESKKKYVYFKSNDDSQTPHKLIIDLKVHSPIQVNPLNLHFNAQKGAESKELVKFFSKEKDDFLDQATSSNIFITTKITPVPLSNPKESQEWDILVELSPKYPVGKIDEKLTLTTKSGKSYTLPVQGYVWSEIRAIPSKVTFSSKTQFKRLYHIKLIANNSSEIIIDHIETPTWIKAKIVSKPSNWSLDIEQHGIPKESPDGTRLIEEEVIIHTKEPTALTKVKVVYVF